MHSADNFSVQSWSIPFNRLAIGALFLVLLFIYLFFPSQQYDRDTLYELARINSLNRSSSDPAHMLYINMGIPLYRFWLYLGFTGDSLRIMQIFNAFCGAGAITIFAIILIQINIRRMISFLFTFMVAFSYAFWTHTTEAFFIIPAAFFSLIALSCSIELASLNESRRWIVTICLSFSLSFSMLCYQNNILLIPALMAASFGGIFRCRTWINQWIIIIILTLITAGSIWAYQGIYLAKIDNAKELAGWFLSGHGGIYRGLWRREGVPLVSTTIVAWLATVFPVYEGVRLRELLGQEIFEMVRISIRLALLIFIAFLTLTFFRLICSARYYQKILKPNLWVAFLLWFCIPGITVIWFDRAEVKLWIIPMISIWIILAALFDFDLKNRIKKKIFRKIVLGFLTMVFIVISLTNYLFAIWPNFKHPSTEIQKAKKVIPKLTSKDLLITSGFDWTRYVWYFCPDCSVVNILTIAQRYSKAEELRILEILLQEVNTAYKRGGKVYLVEYMGMPNSPIWGKWITPYTGITPDSFAEYNMRKAWDVENEIVWELKPRDSPKISDNVLSSDQDHERSDE